LSVSTEQTSPLYVAALSGDLAGIGAQLQAGADPNEESPAEGQGLPLCAAACWRNTEAVRALVAGGADPNRAEDAGSGYTPLAWAVQNDDPETVRALLEAGADANRLVHGRSPLAIAKDLGAASAVAVLVSHGALVARDSERSA
jgi:ankyrin repeat protein